MITSQDLFHAAELLNNVTYEEDGNLKELIEKKIHLSDFPNIKILEIAFEEAYLNIPIALKKYIPNNTVEVYNQLQNSESNKITRKAMEEIIAKLSAMYVEYEHKPTQLCRRKIELSVNSDILKENFLQACESIPIYLEKYIPDDIADIYNRLVDNTDIDIDIEQLPPKTKISNRPNGEGELAGKSIFGHKLNYQSGKIDEILLRGIAVTLDEIAKEIGATEQRVALHVNYLPSLGANLIIDGTNPKKYYIIK